MVHPAMCHLAFDTMRTVSKLTRIGLQGVWQASENEVRAAVNFGDAVLARKILKRNKEVLAAVLKLDCEMFGRFFEGPVLQGVKGFVEKGIEENWRFPQWVSHSDAPGVQFGRWVRGL